MTPERSHLDRAGLALAAVALLVIGFSAGRSSAASRTTEPPAPRGCQCEPAWVRAELALELLSDCRQALLECMARGVR